LEQVWGSHGGSVNKRRIKPISSRSSSPLCGVKLLPKEEEKLATQQAETLIVHCKKFRMMEGIMTDKTAHTLDLRRFEVIKKN
jgi:hypothetical protein